MNYTYYISSPLISGTQYGSKGFASPMKELNEQTVLVESCENKNDSYRQKTKYDDRVDGYFSTYDLGILLQNRDSCLEGKLDSDGDVDYYSFSYGQKSFYEKMGVGTEITIRLENIPEGSDYDLAVYDAKGRRTRGSWSASSWRESTSTSSQRRKETGRKGCGAAFPSCPAFCGFTL